MIRKLLYLEIDFDHFLLVFFLLCAVMFLGYLYMIHYTIEEFMARDHFAPRDFVIGVGAYKFHRYFRPIRRRLCFKP